MAALGTFWESVNDRRKEDKTKRKGEKEGSMEGRDGVRKTNMSTRKERQGIKRKETKGKGGRKERGKERTCPYSRVIISLFSF